MSQRPVANECCKALIANYEAAWQPPRDGAALFCRACSTRVVLKNGQWVEEDA